MLSTWTLQRARMGSALTRVLNETAPVEPFIFGRHAHIPGVEVKREESQLVVQLLKRRSDGIHRTHPTDINLGYSRYSLSLSPLGQLYTHQDHSAAQPRGVSGDEFFPPLQLRHMRNVIITRTITAPLSPPHDAHTTNPYRPRQSRLIMSYCDARSVVCPLCQISRLRLFAVP